jgi:hypothetical protein
VTASTISRNLKKIKDKCIDLLTIEQNRNVEEKFAALVFSFIPQEVSNGMTNRGQSSFVNTDNDCEQIAENNF